MNEDHAGVVHETLNGQAKFTQLYCSSLESIFVSLSCSCLFVCFWIVCELASIFKILTCLFRLDAEDAVAKFSMSANYDVTQWCPFQLESHHRHAFPLCYTASCTSF